MKWISTSFLIFFISSPALAKTYSRVFADNYDTVWKGVLIALASYPLDENDQETGQITTSLIQGSKAWSPYGETRSDREEYKIKVRAHKRSYKGRQVIQVTVEKNLKRSGDFLNAEKELETDGIEEQIILYRAAREIKIDRIIEKLFE